MIICLDTGCIDCLFNPQYKIFREKINEHGENKNIITTTVINYAERKSGLNLWINQKSLSEDRVNLLRQILDFFNIIEDRILYPSKKQLEFIQNYILK